MKVSLGRYDKNVVYIENNMTALSSTMIIRLSQRPSSCFSDEYGSHPEREKSVTNDYVLVNGKLKA